MRKLFRRKNKLNYLKLTLVTICFLMFSFFILKTEVVRGNSTFIVISEKTALYKEVRDVATEWKNAVLKKDIERLVSFALPEAKISVRNELQNKESELYKFFYNVTSNKQESKISIFDMLNGIKKLKIVVQRDTGLINFGGGLSVFYYDESKIKMAFPVNMDDKKNQSLIDKGELLPMFFFKIEGNWYTSYEFGMEES